MHGESVEIMHMMWTRNRHGPKTVPGGTQDITEARSEMDPSTPTACFLTEGSRKEAIDLPTFLFTPIDPQCMEEHISLALVESFREISINHIFSFAFF